jgi:signal transduction histidine kinase/ligand-binding sensor domain-containing protein
MNSSCLGALPSALSRGEIPISQDYAFRAWEMDDGLPSNNIWCTAQTPDGYLWLGTQYGLVRFDGIKFTRFMRGTTPGLDSNYAHKVFSSREGDLWIGFERGGVCRLSGGCFEAVLPCAPDGTSVGSVSSFTEGIDGAVWFSIESDERVFRWYQGKLTTFSSHLGTLTGTQTFVYTQGNGRIWFCNTQKCGFFEGAQFHQIDFLGGGDIRIVPSKDGGMWMVCGQQLLYCSKSNDLRTLADLSRFEGMGLINALYEDSGGDLWFGTRSLGLFRYHEGNIVRVPTSHTDVTSISEDREGNLWIGTLGGGLNRIQRQAVWLRGAEKGLHDDVINSLCEDSQDNLWLASGGGSLLRSLDAAHQYFNTPPGKSLEGVMTVYPDSEDGIWLGTVTNGLMRWKDGSYTHEHLDEKITALLVDRQRDLWLAVVNGPLLHRLHGTEVYLPQEEGIIAPLALAEDRAGRIWVGTEGGFVFQRKKDQFVHVLLPGAKTDEPVRFIVPDKDDIVWIGTRGGGLYRWQAGQVVRLSQGAGFPTDDLRSLAIDLEGNFWIGTEQGLFRVERSEMEGAFVEHPRLMRYFSYGRNEGLSSLEFAFGFRNATTRTRDGHLWMATFRGALEIVPEDFRSPSQPAPIQIENIAVGDGILPQQNRTGYALPPNPGRVEIHYTVPELSTPEQISFRYRLAGLSNEWTNDHGERMAIFSHLPPGKYRLEIEATEVNGLWSPVTASLAFSVRSEWWEITWFRWSVGLLSALALIWVVWLLAKRRMQGRRRLLEQRNALERERTRIARDMHDELGASLTRIALMSELAVLETETPEPANERLKEIAQTSRKVSGTLDQLVWMVNPRNDTLDQLVGYLGDFAREYLETTGVALYLELPRELPALDVPSDARHQILLAVKETLNNVVKYAHAREVRLCIAFASGRLKISISDDGSGFNPETVSTRGNGLGNIRQRIISLGGGAQIESRLGVGTCIILGIPLGIQKTKS